MKTNIHFWSYLAHFFLEWRNVSDTHFRENHNTHFISNNFFSRKLCLYEIMWENIAEDRPQTTIWRIGIACWIQTNTIEICNNYYFSTATIFNRKRFNGTLKFHCLSCSQFVTIIATKIRALNQTRNCKYDNQASSSVFLSAKNHSP